MRAVKKFTFDRGHYHLIRKNSDGTYDSECVMADERRCVSTAKTKELYKAAARTRLLFSDPSR